LAAFKATLGFRNNRLIVIQNWSSISGDAAALQALVTTLLAGPSCLTGAPVGLTSTRLNATAWQLGWTMPGLDTEAQTLVVALVGTALLPSGQLAVPLQVTPLAASDAAFTLVIPGALGPEPFYWQVLASGCGGTQAIVADVLQLAP
jgi:hypothetical protein